MSAEDALGVSGLGHRFKEHFDAACNTRGIGRVDWGQGLWQQVERIHNGRVKYIHGNLAQAELFPGLAVADEAIATLRAAVIDVYRMTGKASPAWVADDNVPMPSMPGIGGGSGAIGFLTRRDNVAADDPARIRTTYVYRDVEYEAYIDPPGTDPVERMNDLLNGTIVPISCVRSYRGDTLIEEWRVHMRGGPRP